MEPWQQQDHATAPAYDPVGWEPNNIIAALRGLGVLKNGEQPRVLHQHACPFPKNPMARCSCTGGPEIQWPDHDELTPIRNYQIPKRFAATV
ncbi:MAG TPA: hypothetical protein VIV83_07555 [Gemmatimonadales bacterium]